MAIYDTIIIGGGAAGIVAAIASCRAGASVLLCEKMPKLGKKLLVTGAGRCNLLNETLNETFYNPDSRALVRSVFDRFGKEGILTFFKELGLATFADETGRIFPVTNQAASVLKVLEMELARLRAAVKLSCEIKSIRPVREGFEVRSQSGKSTGRALILCAGGKSYPALGADGNGYALAAGFGHTVLEPVPSTVPLAVKDPWCHALQGQKIRAKVTSRIAGKEVRTAAGELLFTQYGLSGTAILDISDEISIAMNREQATDVSVELDLIPFMEDKVLTEEFSERLRRKVSREDLLEGLLPHKFSGLLRGTLQTAAPAAITSLLKRKIFSVSGTRGWNEAEFTAGGVPVKEVDFRTLGSKLQKGLYFAGEILDVQGRRGGYNLAWAWASGMLAGRSVSA